MLQEGNQGGRHRDDLFRRDIHILSAIRRGQHEFVLIATRHHLIGQAAVAIQRRVSLSDDELAFLNRRKIINGIGHPAVGHAPVRRFQKAVLVSTRIDRQGVDQANIRAFWRLNRAHSAVMSGVYIAHFKARPLTSQTARA